MDGRKATCISGNCPGNRDKCHIRSELSNDLGQSTCRGHESRERILGVPIRNQDNLRWDSEHTRDD